jgi:cellulose synthase/poly-beta-1,6-N-acetylglucosamine synthase-like glycosyltransferase
MNLESMIEILASLAAIYTFAKNDTPIFSLLKKTFFKLFLTH